MKLCWVNLVTLSIVSTKWLRDHLLLCVVNRFCNFSNVVAPGHKKLYWSPFTNSLSVSLQMLWPSAMSVGDTFYLLLSKYHGDTCNKFNSNERGPWNHLSIWDLICDWLYHRQPEPRTRAIDSPFIRIKSIAWGPV